MEITEITDPERKSVACAAIIGKLPGWFGIRASNERFVKDIADKDVFAALVDQRPIGLISLRYHFQMTAEFGGWGSCRSITARESVGVCSMPLKQGLRKSDAQRWQ